jgi:hypothetical protein
MFGIIGLLIGFLFSTSKFAAKSLVRLAVYGLLGYLGYELIVGFVRGRQTPAPAAAPPAPEPADEAPVPDALRSPLTGAEKRGRSVDVVDAGGVSHKARVGRGVIRR